MYLVFVSNSLLGFAIWFLFFCMCKINIDTNMDHSHCLTAMVFISSFLLYVNSRVVNARGFPLNVLF